MALHSTDGAAAPGLTALEQSTSDTAHVASAGRVEEDERSKSPDFRCVPNPRQALRVIEGEAKARHYLARLQAQQADPDELALIVSILYGPTLRGFCRVLAKAMEVRRG